MKQVYLNAILCEAWSSHSKEPLAFSFLQHSTSQSTVTISAPSAPVGLLKKIPGKNGKKQYGE
jgi:hypothetical protein